MKTKKLLIVTFMVITPIKKMLLLSMVLLSVTLATSVYGQTSNDTSNSTKFVYCELVTNKNPFNTKVTVSLDFGEEIVNYMKDTRLRDEQTGKVVKFKTSVDALNYMGNLGWELVQIYTITNDQTNIHWLLKKKY